jgi:vancomycin resistance protein YoaR
MFITVAFGALTLSAVGGIIAFERLYGDRVLPNVTISGTSVAGLAHSEAEAALKAHHADFLNVPVRLTYGDRTWLPSLEQLGVTVHVHDAVIEALSAGRQPSLFSSAPEAMLIVRDGLELPLTATVDEQQLRAYLETLAAEVDQAPIDATIQVVAGKIETTPASEGRRLQIDPAFAALRVSLLTLEPQAVTLAAERLLPSIDDAVVQSAAERIAPLLAGPLTVTLGETSRMWSADEIGQMLTLTPTQATVSQPARVEVTLEPMALRSWLEEQAPAFAVPPVEPRLRFAGGALEIQEPGGDGARLDIASALTALTDALWAGRREVQLSVSPVSPQARPETFAGLGITELVAEGRSSFRNSAPYRVQNIRAGARRMNGVLIPPGAEFSFNQTVGNINAANGFTEGYAIIDGRTQLEWGGGICQVSTTVFRAAFYGGLPITERNQHSFRISWYEELGEPPGLDAAIFTGPGGYDMRFVNDTGRWLLMQTEVDSARAVLRVKLYGTDPGRQVTQLEARIANQVPAPTEPKYVFDPELPPGAVRQTDTARGGFDVRIGRVVRQGDTLLYEDTFFSRYKAWPNIFVRGPELPPQPTPDPAVIDPSQLPPAPESAGGAAPAPAEPAQPAQPAPEQPVAPTPVAQPEG